MEELNAVFVSFFKVLNGPMKIPVCAVSEPHHTMVGKIGI